MRNKIYLIIVTILTLSSNGLTQVITSGGTSIHVNTKKYAEAPDEAPPVITIKSPDFSTGQPVIIHQDIITIIGQISDRSKIKAFYINGVPTTLPEDNIFISNIALKEGSNDLLVIAIDQYDNIQQSKFDIIYSPEAITFRTLNGKGHYYALLIGVNEYSDPAISNLDNPISDAERLKEILLENYSFGEEYINLLKNPTSEEIIIAFDELANKIQPDDNLLIFYAGHGWWDEAANIGYWLPSDAKQTNKAAWFRNSTLCDYLKEINSRHTLLIADACFGGSIFKTRMPFNDAPKAINRLYELRSRKAMTSGTLTQVPDRSAFTKYLLDRLAENKEKYLTSEQLFSSFRMAVINNSDVVPQYGEIYNVGDEGGDFVFIRKD
jgi:hypothetical protein